LRVLFLGLENPVSLTGDDEMNFPGWNYQSLNYAIAYEDMS